MHQAACLFSEIKSGAMQVHQASRIFQRKSLRGEREVENAVSFRSAGHESLDVKTGTGPNEKPQFVSTAQALEDRGKQGGLDKKQDGAT